MFRSAGGIQSNTGAMTADDFRRLALAMDGAVERSHMNHPDFRANGRIFATLHSHDEFGMVKVTPAEQRELMHAHPGMFVPSSGAWGRQGCTNVRLATADVRTVQGAMILAWEGVGRQKAEGRRRKAKGQRPKVNRRHKL
jgi:hypothetical protein